MPGNDDERLLAERYREFVRALERNEADAICRQLDEKLAESYRCGFRFRIPRDLQGIEVPLTEIFAVSDPSVPLEIQISARSRRADGGRLILFVRRSGDDWRVKETMIGFYG